MSFPGSKELFSDAYFDGTLDVKYKDGKIESASFYGFKEHTWYQEIKNSGGPFKEANLDIEIKHDIRTSYGTATEKTTFSSEAVEGELPFQEKNTSLNSTIEYSSKSLVPSSQLGADKYFAKSSIAFYGTFKFKGDYWLEGNGKVKQNFYASFFKASLDTEGQLRLGFEFTTNPTDYVRLGTDTEGVLKVGLNKRK